MENKCIKNKNKYQEDENNRPNRDKGVTFTIWIHILFM